MKQDKEKSTVNMEDEVSRESAENSETSEKTGESSVSGECGNKKLRGAVIRMAAAVAAAVILLAITAFAPVMLLKGPEETEAIQNNEPGDFVYRDIYAILGFYADDKGKSGETMGRYALVPMNGELVSVHFTKRYLESADAVCDNTYDFINGRAEKLDKYVTVEGTVEEIGEDASALMYDWFGANKAQLVEMRMIADTEDYSDHLSDYLLEVDTVKSHNETYVYVTGIIAAMLLLYAIVEIVLMASGFYLPRTAGAQSCVSAGCGPDGENEISGEKTEDEKSEDYEPEDKE